MSKKFTDKVVEVLENDKTLAQMAEEATRTASRYDWGTIVEKRWSIFRVCPGKSKEVLTRHDQKGQSHCNQAVILNVLDVGCGEMARGDVNVDVCVPRVRPLNFVLASAEHLPFRSRAFRIVRSSYVVEHCTDCTRLIMEHVRCCQEKAIVATDNSEWLGDRLFRLVRRGRIYHPQHCYQWTVEYLDNLLQRLGLKATVRACNFSPTAVVKVASLLGRLPRIGVWFFRDLVAEIYCDDDVADMDLDCCETQGSEITRR